MSEPKEQSRAQQLMGDFAPKLAELTDDVLFGDVWARAELSPRDRSLVTVAALIANGNTEQLPSHLNRARANGISWRSTTSPRGGTSRFRSSPRTASRSASRRSTLGNNHRVRPPLGRTLHPEVGREAHAPVREARATSPLRLLDRQRHGVRGDASAHPCMAGLVVEG